MQVYSIILARSPWVIAKLANSLCLKVQITDADEVEMHSLMRATEDRGNPHRSRPQILRP